MEKEDCQNECDKAPKHDPTENFSLMILAAFIDNHHGNLTGCTRIQLCAVASFIFSFSELCKKTFSP